MNASQFPGQTLQPVPPSALLGGDDEFSTLQKCNQLLYNWLNGGGAPTNPNNALVPMDAPIQPPQAFVNCTILEVLLAIRATSTIDWSNREITFLDSSNGGLLFQIDKVYSSLNGVGVALNLSGNAIVNVDDILAILASNGNMGGILNLSGGTTVDPTGGLANADLVTLGNNGWSGFVNIAGVPTAFP